MPIVPMQQATISMDVAGASGVSPENAGTVNRAIGNLGAQTANVALDLLGKLKGFENSDAVMKQSADDVIWRKTVLADIENNELYADGKVWTGQYDETKKKIYQKNADGTDKTVTELYTEKANERFVKAQESMPTYMAQQQYKQAQHDYFTGGIGAAWGVEQKAKLNYFKMDLSRDAQKWADNFFVTPDPTLRDFYQVGDTIVTRVQSGVKGQLLDKLEGEGQIREILSKSAEANIDGQTHVLEARLRVAKNMAKSGDPSAIVDLLGERDKILAQLDGKDQASQRRDGLYTLSNVLTPEQQDRLRGKLDGILGAALKDKEARLAPYNEAIKNMQGLLESNRSPKTAMQLVPDILKLAEPFVREDTHSPDQVVNDIADTFASEVIGKIDSYSFRKMSPDAQRNMENRALSRMDSLMGQFKAVYAKNEYVQRYGAAMGGKAIQRVKDKFETMIDTQTKQFRSDPGAMLSDSDPTGLASMRNAIKFNDISSINTPVFYKYFSSLAHDIKQKGGDSTMNVLPKDEAAKLVASLKSSREVGSDPWNKVQAIYNFYQKDKDTAAALMNDLIHNGLPPEFLLIKQMPSETLARDFAAHLIDPTKAEIDNFKERIGGEAAYSSFKAQVNPLFEPIAQAMAAEAPADVNQAETIRTLREFFQKQVIRETVSPTGAKTVDEAAKNVLNALHGRWSNTFQIQSKQKKPYFVRMQKVLINGAVTDESDQPKVQNFVTNVLDAKFIKKIGIDLPKDWPANVSQDRIYQAIAETGLVKPDPKNPERWNLVFSNPYSGGSEQPVYKNGKSFSFQLQDVLRLGKIRDKDTFQGQLMMLIEGALQVKKGSIKVNPNPPGKF